MQLVFVLTRLSSLALNVTYQMRNARSCCCGTCQIMSKTPRSHRDSLSSEKLTCCKLSASYISFHSPHRYMSRRCGFLETLPAFNYNTGGGEYITDKQGKRVRTDTRQLGSTLMMTMLKEVKDFCDPAIKENWSLKPHQQVTTQKVEETLTTDFYQGHSFHISHLFFFPFSFFLLPFSFPSPLLLSFPSPLLSSP